MAISQELKEIYATAPRNTFYVEALSLFHKGFNDKGGAGDAIHITNRPVFFKADFLHHNGNTYNGTFNPVPFQIKLPKQDATGTADMDVVIANANITSGNSGFTMLDRIESATDYPMTPMILMYRIYVSTGGVVDPAEHLNPAIRLDVTSIQVTGETISMSASKMSLHNRAFPANVYNVNDFPGLR